MRGEYDDEEDWAPVEDLIAGLDLDPFDPLARTGSDPSPGTRAIRWRDLPPELASVEWATLREWVEWVTTRFDVPITLIPNCWWKHPALVEELSALHVAWRTATTNRTPGSGRSCGSSGGTRPRPGFVRRTPGRAPADTKTRRDVPGKAQPTRANGTPG